jgi:hypothetical protein
MPLLGVLAISWGRWSELTAYDWRIGYLFMGPFTLVGAFAVAWPSYLLQRKDKPETARVAVSLLVCAAIGTVMLAPLSDRIPWEGAGFGAATFLIWITIYRIGCLPLGGFNEVRSKPSG